MEISGELQGTKRKYFVAFNYWCKDGGQGVGCQQIEASLPISDWEDILKISDWILSCNPKMEKIVISNWRRFEDPE